MTTREAEQAINSCEDQIVQEYDRAIGAAKNVALSAEQAERKSRMTKTLMTLIVSLLGLFLFLAEHPVLGAAVVIGGFVLAYKVYDSATGSVKRVESAANNLRSSLDRNSKI